MGEWPEDSQHDTGRVSWSLVVLFFLALAVVQTWPLALHMNDHAMAWPWDSYQNWWGMVTFKRALLDLSNPFHTSDLNYPQGSDLYLHSLTPVIGLLTLPVQMLTGNPLLAWNILVFVFISLSGVGGYALAHHITRDRWAPLFGGFFFAFSPYVMMQLNLHPDIATTWPIPLFVLFLLRFFQRRSRRDLALAAALGAVMTWNWLEFAIDAGLFAILLFAFWAILKARRGQRGAIPPMMRSLLPGIVLWAVLSAPILIPTVLAVGSGDYTITRGASEAQYYSPDVTSYFTPSSIWGPGEYAKNYAKPYSVPVGGIETTMFLGFSPMVLATVAIARRKTSPLRVSIGFWGITFAFFAVMALGPQLRVFALDLPIPLPFRLLEFVPIIGARRVPGRMIIVGTLALGVLASIGLSMVMRQRAVRFRNAGPAIACVALALVFVELWNAPVGLTSYRVPQIYHEMADEPGDYTVIDLPLGRGTGTVLQGDLGGGALADYAQVIDGKAHVGGYISRVKDADLQWLAEQPGLGYLSCLDCVGYPRAMDNDVPLVRARFDDLNIKYVVINLVTFEGDPTILTTEGTAADAEAYIAGLGLEEVSSGEGWLAYRNPDVP